MMAGQHTPGPWKVPHFARPEVNCNCGYVLVGHLMGAVCTVHTTAEGSDWTKSGDNPRFDEACANALLIAAAPDLLEAARALDALWTKDVPHGPGKPGENSIFAPETLDVWRAIRAAIAKATGASS